MTPPPKECPSHSNGVASICGSEIMVQIRDAQCNMLGCLGGELGTDLSAGG